MLTKKIIKKMNSATKIGSKNRKHPKGVLEPVMVFMTPKTENFTI